MKFDSVRLVFLTAVAFSSPLFADESTDMLSKALDLVQQASNPANADTQRIGLLIQALDSTRNVPLHRLQGHRVLAIQDIRAAMLELRQGDANHKAADDLHAATDELSASLALAKSAAPETTASTPPSLAPASSPTPAVPGASPPPTHVSNFLPPSVTPEMEQAFLARLKAALAGQNVDASSLIADDPAMDPKTRDDINALMILPLALATSNPDRTYLFVSPDAVARDKPAPIDGKMYDAYVPAVAGLKIIFGPPPGHTPGAGVATGSGILPLCLQNQQLMIDGLKQVSGAVPAPPPFDKSSNFGLTPNLRKTVTFGNDFSSLDDFLGSLRQPALNLLAAGETDFEYYAICRVQPDLLIYANHNRPGHGNYGWYIQFTDARQQPLKGEHTWVRLVDTPTDDKPAPLVQGTVFHLPPNYSGPVTVKVDYTDDSGAKAPSFSRTIDVK